MLLRARLALLVSVLMTLLAASDMPAAAQVTDAEQALIEKYVPVLRLVPQEQACDPNGEPYDAGPAAIVLDDPAISVRWDVPGQPVVMTGPSAEDLARLDDTFYLDYAGNPLQPGCTYEQQSRERMTGQTATTHAHIAREPGRDGLAIQYWFFYYFNDYNNTHEGDWEMIQVVFDVNTVEEALRTDPVEVGYAQHGGGEWAGWNDGKFEREGGHPVVYVSRGSHASQFDRAVYLSWGENNTGFGCDVTTGADLRVPLRPVLIGGGSDPNAVPAWVAFEGRWGQKATWEFSGPFGPSQSVKWAQPLTWQEDLRPSSLAVPLSGALGPTPTNAFCQLSASSSDLFRLWAESPWAAALLIAAGVAVVAALFAVTGRTLVAALRLYLRNVPAFLPAGGAVLGIGLLVSGVGWLGNMVYDRGPLSDAPVVWSSFTFIGHLAQQLVALVLIAPMAIYATGELLAGRTPTAREVLAHERLFLRRLVQALVRPLAIIGVLSLLPLGVIPATYLTVQRVFIPHAVVLERAGPRESWGRSVRLVRRRWWRTATLTGTLAALVTIPSPVIGLLLLIFAARSVEFVNIASSLVYAVVSPFIYVATTIYFLRIRQDRMEEAAVPEMEAVAQDARA
ncbi:MAG TPA: Vps62-related protein [Thermomicrobiales bacterium]|nr:Vps62-related protein [Thermomicrobiales bacterium]